MTNEQKVQIIDYIPKGAMYYWFFIKRTWAAGVQNLSIMNEEIAVPLFTVKNVLCKYAENSSE